MQQAAEHEITNDLSEVVGQVVALLGRDPIANSISDEPGGFHNCAGMKDNLSYTLDVAGSHSVNCLL